MLIKTVLRILGVVAPSCAIYIFCHKFLLSSLDQLPLSIILAILMLLLLYLEAHDESHDEAHEKLQGDMTETERQILNYCVEPKSTPELLKLLGYSTRTGNYKSALSSLLAGGYLEMTIPGSPRSRNQKYKSTLKGKLLVHND